jgi:hypothetical protein
MSRVISGESLAVRNQEGGVKVKVIQFFQILSGSIRVQDGKEEMVPELAASIGSCFNNKGWGRRRTATWVENTKLAKS